MKENGKKAHSAFHQEHVQVLNSLTDTLKDELKRGLNLLDNCVNQLAQAKWILINVERTIEDFYTDCPACEKASTRSSGANNRGSSPSPVAITPQQKKTPAAATGKGKKASSSPPASAQKPKASVPKESKSSKKTKAKEKDAAAAAATPKVRGRGSGSTALATASAIAHVGISADEFEDTVVKTEKINDSPASPSPRKKKPGPLSKTRVRTSGGPPDFTVDGTSVDVTLDDIGDLLRGQTFFKGDELKNVLKLIGGDSVELEVPSKTDKKEKSSKSESSKVENEKKRKAVLDSDASDEDVQADTRKKKLEEKQSSMNTFSTLKAATATSTPALPSIKPEMKSLIQSTFLKFARSKDLLGKYKGEDKASPKTDNLSIKSKSSKLKSAEGSDTEDDKKKPTAQVTEKKSAISDNSDSDSMSRNKSKRKSKDTDDSDEDGSYRKKPAVKRKKSKQVDSSDDSDPEFSVTPKKRPAITPKSRTKSTDSKFKSPEVVDTDSSSDDDDNSSRRNKRKKTAGKRTPSVRESPEKSPVRRSSHENKSPVRRTSRDDSPGSRSGKANRKTGKDSDDEGSVRSSVKSIPSVTAAKPKLNRPGPKSVKLRLEKEREAQALKEAVKDVDNTTDVAENSSSKPTDSKMFSDSDSEDSEVAQIKKKFPLDLQDAARSPSPQPADLFGKLLSTYNYNPDGNKANSKLQELKSKAKKLTSKVYELNGQVQKKLSSVGRELVPYTGSVVASDDAFTIGKYYIVGQVDSEKLVFFDDNSELQELNLAEDDLEELLD